ncbi:hypothetical protein EGW08_014671 [Elysia chlorotica]|uniref:Uncharacterized protein n=1 Tax=Elysia chlorotica TaxID=188477 RepID=A0A433T7K0_ELYCH|nr:hypothetical protein EGW08_014671 [Elysia chlorotica]
MVRAVMWAGEGRGILERGRGIPGRRRDKPNGAWQNKKEACPTGEGRGILERGRGIQGRRRAKLVSGRVLPEVNESHPARLAEALPLTAARNLRRAVNVLDVEHRGAPGLCRHLDAAVPAAAAVVAGSGGSGGCGSRRCAWRYEFASLCKEEAAGEKLWCWYSFTDSSLLIELGFLQCVNPSREAALTTYKELVLIAKLKEPALTPGGADGQRDNVRCDRGKRLSYSDESNPINSKATPSLLYN